MDVAPTQIATLRAALVADGFAVIRGLLDPPLLDALTAAFVAHEQSDIPRSEEILYTHQAPPPPRPGMRVLMDQWLNPHRRSDQLSTAPSAAQLAPQVAAWLGEDVVLFQDVLMAKHAGHAAFPWHQDFPFWPVDRPCGLVLWAPLDPVEANGGGLKLAQGSQGTCGPAIDLHTGAAQPGSCGEVLALHAYTIVSPTLAVGDAVVFHPLAWHGSPRNSSGRRRRVWAATWLGASARWQHQRAPRHPLCRRVQDGAPVGVIPGGAA